MGASPDRIVTCECCGRGVLEVKHPFSCKDKTFLEATAETRFFLTKQNGTFILKRNHAYYYQIQLQMKVCGTSFGDFIVWRENELVVERIANDDTFLTEALEKATNFFKLGVLPEVLAKWYSRLPEYSQTSAESIQALDTQDIWCFCMQI